MSTDSHVNIDGRTIPFEPGETIIQVASRSGIEIPYYCWHPKLSVEANCRMCLVEVDKGARLQPACQIECKDGMQVDTGNDRVQDAQRAVHEFLLINHPIDCPICDQAGECKLQDYYMKFQLTSSRMEDRKVAKPRLEKLGPHVLYNAERCIMCTRCVRFMSEVAKDRQLGMFDKGDRSYIGTFPGKPLDNPYSLNTVDICPVGALTSIPFRFKQRVWDLTRSPSICSGCARGCNIHVEHRSGLVFRLLPRDNDEVNECWMCDEGRLTYNRANKGRLTQPLVKTRSSVEQTTTEKALALAAELLRPFTTERRGMAVAMSLFATCEEAYVIGRFAKSAFQSRGITLLEYASGEEDDLLRVADKNPNRAGIIRVLEDLDLGLQSQADLETTIDQGDVQGLLCVGHQTERASDLAKMAEKLSAFIHIAHAASELSEAAQVTLPSQSWVEVDGTWVNVTERAQRLTPAFAPRGESKPVHEWVQEIASQLELSLIAQTPATIRAEIEQNLPSFRGAELEKVGPMGIQLPPRIGNKTDLETAVLEEE